MNKSSAMVLSAAVVVALAAGEVIAPASAFAHGQSCKKVDEHVITGSFPVYSYWCRPANPDDPNKPVRLDTYVGNTHYGPDWLPCGTPPLPPIVDDVFCP